MVTPSASPFKPSPLSFGTPRSSPFRRQSAASSPTTIRPNTPGSPGGKLATPTQSPTKLSQLHTAEDDDVFTGGSNLPSTARFRGLQPSPSPTRGVSPQPPRSPNGVSPRPRESPQASYFSNRMSPGPRDSHAVSNEILSRVPPAQLREMREAFQVLDRDNDGLVNKEDVMDILNNLGLDSSPSATAAFFPPGTSQTINLPTFLNTIASLLTPLSDSQELLNAFAAFDEDDSGQANFADLRDALLHTLPEGEEKRLSEREIDEVVLGFTGRRAFGGKTARPTSLNASKSRGEVFRYQEWVAKTTGSGQGTKNPAVNA